MQSGDLFVTLFNYLLANSRLELQYRLSQDIKNDENILWKELINLSSVKTSPRLKFRYIGMSYWDKALNMGLIVEVKKHIKRYRGLVDNMSYQQVALQI